jgi:hypothetical protein
MSNNTEQVAADGKEQEHHSMSREASIVSAALAGVALATVIQLLQVPSLTWQLNVSLHCMVASLPLSVLMYGVYAVSPQKKDVLSSFQLSLLLLASLILLFGLGFLIWHLSSSAALVFAASIAIAVVLEMLR